MDRSKRSTRQLTLPTFMTLASAMRPGKPQPSVEGIFLPLLPAEKKNMASGMDAITFFMTVVADEEVVHEPSEVEKMRAPRL